MGHDTFDVSLALQEEHRFEVDFGQDGVPPLTLDEPPPLGKGQGPNASRLLAAAVGNCLSASALFCLRKARIDVRGMHTVVTATLTRNERDRMRVSALDAVIRIDVSERDQPRMRRCLEVFEDYCIVTQSVRQGLDVNVRVEPRAEASRRVDSDSSSSPA